MDDDNVVGSRETTNNTYGKVILFQESTYIAEHHELFYEDYQEVVINHLVCVTVVADGSIVFPK